MPDSSRPNERAPEPPSIADAIFPPTEPGHNPPPPVDQYGDPREPAAVDASAEARTPALGDTAGTGTIIALGCIGATLFLIVVGVVILLLLRVF